MVEEENRQALLRLNAKPWRGVCTLCIGTLWCTDTEVEAQRLIEEHQAKEHTLIQVWRDH